MIAVGNASAPRWFGERLSELDDYLSRIVAFGATATEFALHHGAADERIGRVHLLEPQWRPAANKAREHGLRLNFHASLAPQFSLRLWTVERFRMQERYRRVIAFAEEWARESGESPVLVVHAANARESPMETNARATLDFLRWGLEESSARGGSLRFAIELRHEQKGDQPRFDVDRQLLRRFVEQLGEGRVGVCWDIANDLRRFLDQRLRPEAPDAAFLRAVSHVHTHAAGRNGSLHHPFRSPAQPEVAWLGKLERSGYSGAVTMEIRYRHALEAGDPMMVLGASYATVLAALQSGRRGIGRAIA
jgi:hypothetical protein